MNYQQAQKRLKEFQTSELIPQEQLDTAQALLAQAERNRWRGPDMLGAAGVGSILFMEWLETPTAEKTKNFSEHTFEPGVEFRIASNGSFTITLKSLLFETPEKGKGDDLFRLIDKVISKQSKINREDMVESVGPTDE